MYDTIMASKPPEGTLPEADGTSEECSGKKKSKFQAFKKLFVKKKRKESPAPSRESNLKPSQSSSDVSASGANETAFHPAHESVAKSSMGSKAVSHDSVFISEMENSTKEDTSQENTPGKVKALQLQLQQNIRIGSPPQGIVHKKLEDSGTLSEDDGLPRSPPEITSLHEILTQSAGKTCGIAQRRSSLSLGGTDSEDEQETCESSSRPISALNSSILSSPHSLLSNSSLVDFTSPPSSVVCLDNSAAKHKIAVKPKKTRGPAMNVHQVKDKSGISEVLHKNEIKIKICEQEVSPVPEGKTSEEQEQSTEEVRCMEDAMVEETEVDTTVSLRFPEEDSSSENGEDISTSVICETPLTGLQIVALQIEAAESDVDFNSSSLSEDDQILHMGEDPEIKIESTELPQSSHPVPLHELKETTVEHECSIANDTKVELIHLAVSDEIECDESDDCVRIQETSSVFETDTTIDMKDEDHELNEQDTVITLAELQTDVTVNTLNVSQTEAASAVLQANKDVTDTVVEPVLVNDSTDEEQFLTAEKDESSINTADNQSRVKDAPLSDQRAEIVDLRSTESSVDVSVENSRSSKSKIGPINLNTGVKLNDRNAVFVKESCAETGKIIKQPDENDDSKLKTSNKPVRFTVAPAWQRSLSTGAGVKDSAFSKGKAAGAPRSESFDQSEEQEVDFNQETCEKNNEEVKMNKEESCIAFGVKLRRTSSSRKYSDENSEELSKQGLSPVDTVPIAQNRNAQKPSKTLPTRSDSTKSSKQTHTGEEKPQQKQKGEELSSHDSPEPAWIVMAKLKQKGFQEHPLAKESSVTTESEKVEGISESMENKRTATTTKEQEEKKIEPVSDSSAVSEEMQPESSKNLRAVPPQNPEEPPWFSLAKKKAKAWSEMPQIVQ
ncbi:acrosomal protein KIAA1210 homolog isoform X2 [Hyperolius riggenbachi]|uniref:acrosomal protein KIAA1210 homolog isoform X2 n=1 Tax=Hyperolius riggenbachi TaxID=752182 RepID=UPI0035A276BC